MPSVLGRRSTRVLGVLLALAIGLAPALSAARDQQRQYTNKQKCRRMTKQINHFEQDVLVMARDRGNDLWEKATEDHINRLKDERADRCPEWAKQRTAIARAKAEAAAWARLIQMAAKGAAKYFTGGLL